MAAPKQPQNIERLTYSIREACTALGISRSKCFSLINDGSLKVLKLGARTLVTRKALDDLLASCTPAGPS